MQKCKSSYKTVDNWALPHLWLGSEGQSLWTDGTASLLVKNYCLLSVHHPVVPWMVAVGLSLVLLYQPQEKVIIAEYTE